MASKAKAKKSATVPRIGANGYRLCDPLPAGQPLIDNTKHKWILGKPIGSGGFGEIYSCRRDNDRTDDYVIKLDNIEGPLFAEMNFYLRVAKQEAIKDFMTKQGLKFLGMPRYVATGIHDTTSAQTNLKNKEVQNSKKGRTYQYRFLVMQRFGDQLSDWVTKKRLSASDSAEVAVQMIDVLQYIHTFGYIHADIKGPNILKSIPKSKSKATNHWFLVDFGLADKYLNPSGGHKEEKPDKKRANNGTVEYRSRDAHIGLISRRSDIECLAYNLIQWLYGTLPWMTYLSSADRVETTKKEFMNNIDQYLKKCFPKSVPNGLKEFFTEIKKMGFNSEPNYKLLKEILLKKVSKSKLSFEESDDEEEEEEEESEGSDDNVVTSPKRSRNGSKARPKASPQRKRTSPLKGIVRKANTRSKEVIDLSDDSDVSPPKRTKKTINNKIITPLRSLKKPTNRLLPRFSTPLLFCTDDDYSGSDSSPGPQNKSRRSTNSSPEEPRKEGETQEMRKIREMIERKKLEKPLPKNKRKK